MEFDSNKPIYIQIADNISYRILSGEFKPGERIPSVREWGAQIGVNPNTVARAYDILSGNGVISNRRGLGFFASEQALEIIRLGEKKKFLEEELPEFIKRAELLGIDIKSII